MCPGRSIAPPPPVSPASSPSAPGRTTGASTPASPPRTRAALITPSASTPATSPTTIPGAGRSPKFPIIIAAPPPPARRPVALGEIGLDRFHLPKEPAPAAAAFARQEAAFRAQLALARELACPIVIHSRDAFADCLRVIDESGVDWRRVVFHCFTHGPDEFRTLRERGGRASFTGIITYKNAAPVRAALIAQGLDVLMLETDAPYLAPIPHRGQPNEPAFLAHTAHEAARLLNLPLDELAARTTAHAREFFGLQVMNPGKKHCRSQRRKLGLSGRVHRQPRLR